MPVEYNPSDFTQQNAGNIAPQPQAAPVQFQTQGQTNAPSLMPSQHAPNPGLAQPYSPAQPYSTPPTAPALGQPHQHSVPPMPQQAPQTMPGGQYQAYPPAHIQQQIQQQQLTQQQAQMQPVQNYASAPQQQVQNVDPKAKASKRKRPPKVKGDKASGFLKPFLVGLFSGGALATISIAALGTMAKKSQTEKFNSIAAAVQTTPELTTETVAIVEPQAEQNPGQ